LYRAVLLQTVNTGTFTQYVWNIAQNDVVNYDVITILIHAQCP